MYARDRRALQVPALFWSKFYRIGGQGAQGAGLCPGVFRGFLADIDGKAEIEPVAGRVLKM
jgi:hypothetical protein